MIHYARQVMRLAPTPRHVIDLVDVDSAKWQDYAVRSRPPIRWVYKMESKRLAQIEAGQSDHYDAVTVVSDAEANLYRRRIGEHPGLSVLRHAVDVDYFRPQHDVIGHTILFVGVLNYKPNAQGICWFAHNVIPLLRRRIGGVTLKIIGHHVTPQVAALCDIEGVEVVGSVPDVRDYFHEAAAVITPLHMAHGVQTKVLEAMASGRAVVCYHAAPEGILATDGEHLLVANHPQQWADQLCRVLTDTAYRNRLRLGGLRQVEREYPWHKCLEPSEALITGKSHGENQAATLNIAA